jgi:hypothetical protein
LEAIGVMMGSVNNGVILWSLMLPSISCSRGRVCELKMLATRRSRKRECGTVVAEKQWELAANASIPEWIVVVPGVIPQVRGYRSEGKEEEVDRVASW